VQGIAMSMRFPDESAVGFNTATTPEEAVLAADEESVMDDLRQELLVLLKNTAKLIPNESISLVFRILRRLLQHPAVIAQCSWQDVEVALMLLYELGEALLDEVNKAGCGEFAEPVKVVMAATMPHQHHRLVASALLECYVSPRLPPCSSAVFSSPHHSIMGACEPALWSTGTR
jgi:hypothetical protein